MSFFENTRKPQGLGGKIMVAMMNSGHSAMAQWGLTHIQSAENSCILDVGCGGGANIKKMLVRCPRGRVSGGDYSPVSVEKSRKVNHKAIADGRCDIIKGSALALPFSENSFAHFLTNAGFADIKVDKNEKGWLCVKAYKGATQKT